jgi:hypothetical protein
VLVTDPKGSGFVQDLGRPGDTLTGFSTFEASVGGKWLGLLKEASPAVTHVSILFNPETAPFADGYLHSAQAVAQTLGGAGHAPQTSVVVVRALRRLNYSSSWGSLFSARATNN